MYIFKIQNCIFALIVHWEKQGQTIWRGYKRRNPVKHCKNIVSKLSGHLRQYPAPLEENKIQTTSNRLHGESGTRVGHFLLVSSKTSFTWAQISVQETSRLLVFKHWRKYLYWADKAYENAKFPTLQRCALLGVCVFQVFHHVTSCFSDITVWARCILGGECSSWGLENALYTRRSSDRQHRSWTQ